LYIPIKFLNQLLQKLTIFTCTYDMIFHYIACALQLDSYYCSLILVLCTFRMENLNLKQQSCQAKVIGTVVSIAGAFIVTLYKGTPLNFSLNVAFGGNGTYLSVQSDWIIGAFLLATASLCISVLLIVQVIEQTILDKYTTVFAV